MIDTDGTSSMRFITRIQVEKLFGRYSYTVEIPKMDSKLSQMSMLYGDNGTGKTTILKLIYNLLSPSSGQSHRGIIARIPFERFKIDFADGVTLQCVRNKGNIEGEYGLYYSDNKRNKFGGVIIPSPEGRVSENNVSDDARKVVEIIRDMNTSIFFLGDDRVLMSDQFQDVEEEEIIFDRTIRDDARRFGRQAVRQVSDWRNREIRQSLRRTEQWLSRRSIFVSSKGEEESQQIYANLMETINLKGLPPKSTYEDERNKLIKELKDLGRTSSSLDKFGLIPKIDDARFINSIKTTTEDELPFILQVARSFVNGQQARLEQMNILYNQINRFTSVINGFLRDKHIAIDTREGISIFIDDSEQQKLNVDNLSSGEKQLILLFCNVLTSSERASIFLIDEPEISLNIKWQRKLVDSLLDIAGESKGQFVLATHSIELLSKHMSQTIKLIKVK